MRVAVLCPTRDRPDGLGRLIESVERTSKDASVLAYVDDDQAGLYGRFLPDVGPRIGPVASANRLVELHPDYDVYGLMTDDSVVTTPGWDEWVLDVVKQFPNRIGVVSPYNSYGDSVDMPFVSKEWIEAVGWFACPECHHYSWPTVTGLIGEMSAICHAPKQSFAISHDYEEGTYPERRAKDALAFYDFVSLRLMETVERVRKAMA